MQVCVKVAENEILGCGIGAQEEVSSLVGR